MGEGNKGRSVEPVLRDLAWRKSMASDSGNKENCVEVAIGEGLVLVRDSKNRSGPILRFPPGAWNAFAAELYGAHE